MFVCFITIIITVRHPGNIRWWRKPRSQSKGEHLLSVYYGEYINLIDRCGSLLLGASMIMEECPSIPSPDDVVGGYGTGRGVVKKYFSSSVEDGLKIYRKFPSRLTVPR